MTEFIFRTRRQNLKRFESEVFDFLVIGGGITGTAVARDAAQRGLKVALVEKSDFASGTSSKSSKLIHGGLRYLENFEFSLVFEALAERALLLKTAPHMVHPLPFYFPVYEGDPHGMNVMSLGFWLYDLLALFRTPGMHRRLSKRHFMNAVPFLREKGLKGGFTYFDASMWDDGLAVETARAANHEGAAVCNYIEAYNPILDGERLTGFRLRNLSGLQGEPSDLSVRFKKLIVCAGPWTDHVGRTLDSGWNAWLKPSTGVHLVFDLKRIPVPGALVMSHPEDGRISFVIPRPDLGSGVTIVGTTDGPAPAEPEAAATQEADVRYLMSLLARYFPELKLTENDILSTYVGIRPLMKPPEGEAQQLQKVSREHHIDFGPYGSVVVAGGKYTTHRKMAEEIVEFAIDAWKRDGTPLPALKKPHTHEPVNPGATFGARKSAIQQAVSRGLQIPAPLFARYGSDALEVVQLSAGSKVSDPAGFPCLEGQLRHAIRHAMVIKPEDFLERRVPFEMIFKKREMPERGQLSAVLAAELRK